jgi:hypothetical protein
MLSRTHTPWAPWTLVPGMDPRYLRVQVFRTLADKIEKELGARGISLEPDSDGPPAKPKATKRRPAARRRPRRARA